MLGRRDPRRLEAEPIRDSLLAVSGGLETEMGGSLLRSENFAYVTNDQSTSNEVYTSKRRAIYLPLIRNDMYPFFSIFDYPDSSVAVDARPSTMVAQQALFMMNSPMVASQAERLAGRLLFDESMADPHDVAQQGPTEVNPDFDDVPTGQSVIRDEANVYNIFVPLDVILENCDLSQVEYKMKEEK